ncbi:hypothetical protein Xen7305DRAFT_00053340, partial [Xenococcus sp. PCC 7305]
VVTFSPLFTITNYHYQLKISCCDNNLNTYLFCKRSSIDFETLVIVIFVLVDDWYQLEGKTLRENLPGAKPMMSDSEILTLALIMDYI